MPGEILDAHAPAGPAPYFPARPDELLAQMDRHGVNRAMLAPVDRWLARIIVNAVEPGQIINETDVPAEPTPERVAHWSAIPLGRPGQPEEVAQAVHFLVSPETTYITGTVLRVDGGRTARSPVVVVSSDKAG
jgi:NAD(P)-dependent dehydrogenase (short-subunit alcohol dehydrogenase family)